MKYIPLLKAITGFILLFACYHAAEYMMLFENNPAGFLGLSFVFLAVAWLVAKWQGLDGLAAWGLVFKKPARDQLGTGLLVGICIYTLYTVTSLLLDIDRIKEVPPAGVFISQFALFTLGTFFSSLSEDILTRGYLYRFFNKGKGNYLLVFVSAAVYVLNHIYRLTDGVGVLSYLFIIGIFLMLAMLRTGNIWLTLGLHWSGNIVYHTTHSVMHTVNGKGKFPGEILYVIFLLALIPITWFITRQESTAAKKI